ncbi:hypothetical protein PAXINDRAFT_101297 [Paxillus involutus ATCC 200175]|uniref:F-box domain-containing protein n=1 Tax=Paxillus involutus ATCC 200175 TaxID=664439 RepID=A0A0C9TXG2_PAXIN|nr:hypothetical protein PAXINDRAFT_101297 [Paxillus involutus ATCC 200175]
MHRCLRIKEILLEIFELVFTSQSRHPDLASLARTCRSFSGPALDLLWHEQSSLLPLIMCFPRDILAFSPRIHFAVPPTVKFTKTPTVRDWERPSIYAKRIRTVMPSWHVDTYRLEASVLKTLLQSCPSTPLLPNLRHLNYYLITGRSDGYVGGDTYVTSLFTLFNPDLLQSLEFHSHLSLECRDSHRFLTHLPKYCAQIKRLYVSLLGRSPLEIAAHVTVFASLQHLEVLRFIAVASDLAVDFPSFMNPPNGFPSITNLIVDCRSVITALQIFKAIHSTQLRGINLIFPYNVDIAQLRELLEIIASRPAGKESMRSISLRMGACSMTANDVRGLLTFNHLRHLSLGDTGLVLDDHLLDDMAKAWPMLENLSITNIRLIPSNATLNGLVPFSKHCPHIAFLNLRLDVREVPTFANTSDAPRDESREGDRTALRLCIDGAPEILDPIGVASFLLNLFPRITLSVNYDKPEQSVLWRRVVSIITGTPELDTPPAIS